MKFFDKLKDNLSEVSKEESQLFTDSARNVEQSNVGGPTVVLNMRIYDDEEFDQEFSNRFTR